MGPFAKSKPPRVQFNYPSYKQTNLVPDYLLAGRTPFNLKHPNVAWRANNNNNNQVTYCDAKEEFILDKELMEDMLSLSGVL